MAKYIPTRSFLVRQEDTESGRKKDTTAKKGVAIELSDKEAVKFWGSLKLSDEQQKRLLNVASANGYLRTL